MQSRAAPSAACAGPRPAAAGCSGRRWCRSPPRRARRGSGRRSRRHAACRRVRARWRCRNGAARAGKLVVPSSGSTTQVLEVSSPSIAPPSSSRKPNFGRAPAELRDDGLLRPMVCGRDEVGRPLARDLQVLDLAEIADQVARRLVGGVHHDRYERRAAGHRGVAVVVRQGAGGRLPHPRAGPSVASTLDIGRIAGISRPRARPRRYAAAPSAARRCRAAPACRRRRPSGPSPPVRSRSRSARPYRAGSRRGARPRAIRW